MHKHKSKSKSHRWGPWSEWTWDATQQAYVRVRQDIEGAHDLASPVKPQINTPRYQNPRLYHVLPYHTTTDTIPYHTMPHSTNAIPCRSTPPFLGYLVSRHCFSLYMYYSGIPSTNPGTGVREYEWDQRSLSVAQTPRDAAIEDITDRLGSLSPGTHETHCTIHSTAKMSCFVTETLLYPSSYVEVVPCAHVSIQNSRAHTVHLC